MLPILMVQNHKSNETLTKTRNIKIRRKRREEYKTERKVFLMQTTCSLNCVQFTVSS